MTLTKTLILGTCIMVLAVGATTAGLLAQRVWGQPAEALAVNQPQQQFLLQPAQRGDKAVQKDDKKEDDFGPEVKGLRAKITPTLKQFAVGEAVTIQYVIKNFSKEKRTLWRTVFWYNHRIEVKGADGKEAPLTAEGKKFRQWFSPGGPRDSNVPLVLAPGGERSFPAPFDITQVFDLSKPGVYTVQFIYEEKHGGFDIRLPSNTVKVQIGQFKKGDGKVMLESMPVTVNQLEFRAVAEPKCVVPAPSAKQAFDVGLRVTNQRPGSSVVVNLFDTIYPRLKTADGKSVLLGGGRDRTKPAPPILVKVGQTQTVVRHAELEWQADGKALQLSSPDGSGGWWYFEGLQPGKYRFHLDYAAKSEWETGMPALIKSLNLNELPAADGIFFWHGKAVTNEVEFEIVAAGQPGAGAKARSVKELVADLDSNDGNKRVAATKELFQRGKSVLKELKAAGAKQIASYGGTIETRRLDMIYSLLEGLPPNAPMALAGYRTDSFGLHVEKGTTQADVVAMGTKYGFTEGTFSTEGRPNCYVKIAPGKSLPAVLRDVLTSEPKVTTVNLNYFDQ